MKRHNILVITMVFLLGCISCNGKTTSLESDFLAYEGDFHNDIIKPEVEACKKVAGLMYPRVCDDTDTQWAAALADSLSNDLLNRPNLPVGEQIARLYEIQNIIAYGMSYFSAIIGSHTHPEASEDALRIVRNSYLDMDSLKALKYDDAELLTKFETNTYYNFGLYMELGVPFDAETPQYVINNQQMQQYNFALIIQLFTKLEDKTQAYRYSYIVNNTTFFMTFCPITFLLAGSEFQQEYQEEYIKIGGYFDALLSPVKDKIVADNTSKLSIITTYEFSKILRESSKARTSIINLLATGISTISINQK